MRLFTSLLTASAIFASTLAFAPVSSFAQTAATPSVERYEFDKLHTQILFFVSHLGFSFSEGEFLDFGGHFDLDRANLANSSVDVTIQTASIDMDDTKWDDHMKNQDFFNVEAFPTMTFKSTRVDVTGDNTADIHGDLTILGVTKPVVLKTVHNKSGEHPYSKKMVAGFSATTTIKRSEWGMNYGLPAVGDDVEIRIEVEAVKQDAVQDATEEQEQTNGE